MTGWRQNGDGTANYSLMLEDLVYGAIALVTVLMAVVTFFMSRNYYQRSLRTHAARFFAARQELQNQQKNFLGSMEAEEQVMRVLENEGWRNVYLRRRVAISRIGHNREIDVIAVGNVILVVEVKHWRGYVWSNGTSWFQAANYQAFFERQRKRELVGKGHNQRRGGDNVPAPPALQFENVEEDNVFKAAALRRYIENTRRIALPDFHLVNRKDTTKGESEKDESLVSSPTLTVGTAQGTRYTDEALHKNCGLCVVPVVVFTNPTVVLDPATLKRKPFIFTLDTFCVFAREALRGNVSAVAPNAVVERHSRLRSLISYAARRALRRVPLLRGLVSSQQSSYFLSEDQQADVANAVDVLRTWDLVFMHDGRMITGDVLQVDAPSASCAYERKHLLDINIRWNSTAVLGLVRTLLYNEAGNIELVLTTAKRLAVKKNERKPRDSRGNIKLSIQPRKHKNLHLNDRITVRPAGSAGALQTFAFTDIKDIRLSHHLYESEKYI